MITLLLHCFRRCSLQLLQKLRLLGGYIFHTGAGLDKILPDQDTVLITQIIEQFLLYDPAAPYAHDIDIFIDQSPDIPLIGGSIYIAIEAPYYFL